MQRIRLENYTAAKKREQKDGQIGENGRRAWQKRMEKK